MSTDYLMNTATALYFICYIPEFYANYVNKNANFYNVFEKVCMLLATGFGLGYSVSIHNTALIWNYGPLFGLDCIALGMRSYYAYKNIGKDVRMNFTSLADRPIQRCINKICKENISDLSSNSSLEAIERNPMHNITHTDSDL
jgi:hypothetical protein